MYLEIVILSEVSQRDKHMHTYMYHSCVGFFLKMVQMNLFIKYK